MYYDFWEAIMKGWIIFTNSDNPITSEKYEIDRLTKEAKKENIKIKFIQSEHMDLMVTKNRNKSILLNGKPTAPPNFVISRMGGSTNYHTLAIIRNFERLNTCVINSSHSIEIAKDKLRTHQILTKYNIPVPKTMLLKFPINIKLIEKHFKFPVILKTLSGASGCGVLLANNKKVFNDLMMLIETSNMTTDILIQEFIEHSKGHDLRVIVIGGKVVACMLRQASKGEFKANFSQGASVSNYKLTPEIENLAIKTSTLLNLDIAGIDLLFGKKQMYVCEANSAPGFKGIESCCNINIPKEMYQFIKTKF